MSGIFWALSAPLLALAASLAGIPFIGARYNRRRAVCVLLSLSALAAIGAGMAGLLSNPSETTLPIGFPCMSASTPSVVSFCW